MVGFNISLDGKLIGDKYSTGNSLFSISVLKRRVALFGQLIRKEEVLEVKARYRFFFKDFFLI